MELIIKNGRVVDPYTKKDEVLDIYIKDGIIKKIGKNLDIKCEKEFNAKNMIVTPGLIDIHTHLREPGYESKERISTGTKSAACGGFTAVVCMPNTNPPIDNQAAVKLIHYIAENEGFVKVYPVAAVTKGLAGEELTEFGDLYRVGVVGFSDDGNPIKNSEIMRRALEYAKMFDLPIMDHCEDIQLSNDGTINEGYYSTIKGLKGIPTVSESVIVARDILLTKYTQSKIHLLHITTKDSVELIKIAKEEKVKVTSEVCPHHFALSDKDIPGYDTNYKVNPPLRSEEDRKALIAGLKDGTIDVIASDHAPHTIFEKEKEFNYAPFGIIGLETVVPLTFMHLIEPGHLSIMEAISKLTINPAKILNIKRNNITEGEVADITVINPNLELIYKKELIASKSINSPFINKKLKAFPVLTIVQGKIIMEREKDGTPLIKK